MVIKLITDHHNHGCARAAPLYQKLKHFQNQIVQARPLQPHILAPSPPPPHHFPVMFILSPHTPPLFGRGGAWCIEGRQTRRLFD